MNIKEIVKYLDSFLIKAKRNNIEPVEANEILAKARLLGDSLDSPGLPLRNLLRKGLIPHAFQSGGKGTGWTIPHSNNKNISNINYTSKIVKPKKNIAKIINQKISTSIDISELKKQLEKARLKYKPDNIKYLLIAEAPPDSIERFFYFQDVRQHDYLFLGVAQALYPELKDKFIASRRNSEIKNSILLKFKADGFYLLDLSELPLSLKTGDLSSQLPNLIEKIKAVVNKKTKIILIKATVFDAAFQVLQDKFENVIDIRIPFPGQGGQKIFQIQFLNALKLAMQK